MKYVLALDIRVMNPDDPKLECALRCWNGPLIPAGAGVFIDCGLSEGYMTTVVGHNTMLKPSQIHEEHIEINLEFTAEALGEIPSRDRTWAEAQVAYLLGEGGWKLLS